MSDKTEELYSASAAVNRQIYFAFFISSKLLPCRYFFFNRFNIVDSSIQALGREHIQLNLSNYSTNCHASECALTRTYPHNAFALSGGNIS